LLATGEGNANFWVFNAFDEIASKDIFLPRSFFELIIRHHRKYLAAELMTVFSTCQWFLQQGLQFLFRYEETPNL